MSPKLERLLNLTALLLDTERPLRVDEIGRLMEGYPEDPASFRRTFERDKDDLREMGIPIEVIGLDAGDQTALGYRIIPEKYYLPDPRFEPDELAAIKLALGAIRLDGVEAEDALRKLGGTPDGASGDDAPALASVPTPPEIAEIHAAIAEHRILEFPYHGETRTVEPHRLDYQRGRWYLTGFDRLRDARRSFRIDRMEGTLTSGEPDAFTRPDDPPRPPGLSFDPWRYGDDPPVTARLRIDADQAAVSRSLVGSDSTWTSEPDGSAVVEVVVSDRRAFRTFVLGLLDHAEILEPQELRDDLVAWLEACRA